MLVCSLKEGGIPPRRVLLPPPCRLCPAVALLPPPSLPFAVAASAALAAPLPHRCRCCCRRRRFRRIRLGTTSVRLSPSPLKQYHFCFTYFKPRLGEGVRPHPVKKRGRPPPRAAVLPESLPEQVTDG